MAIGRIGWDSIDRYATRYDIKGDQYEKLQQYITAIDNKYVEIINKDK